MGDTELERIHILAKVDANSLEQVVSDLGKIDGIITIDAVTGPYDMLITIEGESVARMLSSAVRAVRGIPGITSTETLVTINFD